MLRRYAASWRVLPRAQLWMLLGLAAAVAFANVDQPFPEIAPLQHAPTLLLILAAPPLLARWPLSGNATGAIVAFFLLHTIAGRWTYSNVPYDAWAKALTGRTISATLGLHRNDFDRLVHLGFGFLAVPAYTELAQRYCGLSRRGSQWTAFLFVGFVSAAYEIFEWLLTVILAPEMAADYNGQQGDPWDSQKDMVVALLGAMLSASWQAVRDAALSRRARRSAP